MNSPIPSENVPMTAANISLDRSWSNSDGTEPAGEIQMLSACSKEQNHDVVLDIEPAEESIETAVANEQVEKIKEIVSMHPEWLGQIINPSGETILHLAVKKNNVDCVKALLDGVNRSEKKDLLLKQDHEGNTVLHRAVALKSVKVVKLIQDSNPREFEILANTKNCSGDTPRELLYNLDVLRDVAAQEIGHILDDKPANHHITPLQRLVLETRIDLFAVPLLIITLVFTVVCNFPPPILSIPVAKTYGFSEVLSLKLPPAFYILVLSSAAFMDSMRRIMMLLYSLGFLNSFFIVLVCIPIVYVILVSNLVPHFRIKLPYGYDIPSSRVLWVLALIVVVFGTVITSAKCLFWGFITLIKRLLQREYHRFANHDLQHMNSVV